MAFISAIVAVVGIAASASQQRKAAKQQAVELEIQADDERVAAEGRELDRRRKLNRFLAAEQVGQATSGVAGEGSPESLSLANAKVASLSEGAESLSDRLRQQQLKRQSKNVRSAGKVQAGSTLLSGVSKVAQTGAFGS